MAQAGIAMIGLALVGQDLVMNMADHSFTMNWTGHGGDVTSHAYQA